MTTFDDRESAFENKFAHDEDLKFRAAARRNKLVFRKVAGDLVGRADEATIRAKMAELMAEAKRQIMDEV